MSPVSEHIRAMRETYDPQPAGPKDRWPVLRETEPGELLPNPADPVLSAPASSVGFLLGVAALGLVSLAGAAVAVFA